jgi:uncharacterized membrane protein HdeD (DUF308 family)
LESRRARSRQRRTAPPPKLFAALGIASLVFGVLALATGSLTALSLLVATTVLLWAGATLGHVRHVHRPPVAT